MSKKSMTVLIVAVTVVLGVVAYCLLPAQVAVQWGSGGEVSSTLPKLAAVGISFGLTALLLCIAYSKPQKIYLYLAWLGTVVLGIMLIGNL